MAEWLRLPVSSAARSKCGIIKIFHECEVLIEKYVLRVTVWHHEAPPSDAKLWPEGQIFRSGPHTHDRFFFLYTWVSTHELISNLPRNTLHSRQPF